MIIIQAKTEGEVKLGGGGDAVSNVSPVTNITTLCTRYITFIMYLPYIYQILPQGKYFPPKVIAWLQVRKETRGSGRGVGWVGRGLSQVRSKLARLCRQVLPPKSYQHTIAKTSHQILFQKRLNLLKEIIIKKI